MYTAEQIRREVVNHLTAGATGRGIIDPVEYP